jgi:YbgC/YbaW family acyl-CoA thioester hydrolase
MENTFEYKKQILEHHLDSFGHVNNAVYLELYEEARWDFITNNGYGLNEIHERKQGPVILEVQVKYKKELNNREWITIKSFDFYVKGKLMGLKQEMINQNGEVASSAVFTIGFMDLKERRLISPPNEWLKAIGML